MSMLNLIGKEIAAAEEVNHGYGVSGFKLTMTDGTKVAISIYTTNIDQYSSTPFLNVYVKEDDNGPSN